MHICLKTDCTLCTRFNPNAIPGVRMGIGHKLPPLTKDHFSIKTNRKRIPAFFNDMSVVINNTIGQAPCAGVDGQHEMHIIFLVLLFCGLFGYLVLVCYFIHTDFFQFIILIFVFYFLDSHVFL